MRGLTVVIANLKSVFVARGSLSMRAKVRSAGVRTSWQPGGVPKKSVCSV